MFPGMAKAKNRGIFTFAIPRDISFRPEASENIAKRTHLRMAKHLRVHVQRVREILPVTKENIFFPLREAYERANYTLEGIEDHMGLSRTAVDYELPPDAPNDPAVIDNEPAGQPLDEVDGDNYQDDQNLLMSPEAPVDEESSKPQLTHKAPKQERGGSSGSGTVGTATAPPDDLEGSSKPMQKNTNHTSTQPA